MFAKLKALFGGGGGSGESGGPLLPGVEYKGYSIRPAPYLNNGQYQTAGVIQKEGAEGMREHRFIRADTHPSQDGAAEIAIAKAKQIIDERGEAIFAERPQAGS